MNDTPTKHAAICAALAQDWKEAIRINSALLTDNPKDVETLNRLGFAYVKTGQISQARKIFNKVILLDEYNQIALKNLKRLATVNQKDLKASDTVPLTSTVFIAEPGKTKIIECVNVAPYQTLSVLSPGQTVCLKARNHTVEVRTLTKSTYIGALPDDVSFKLIKMMKAGNTFQAIVKGVSKNILIIVLREISRCKKLAGQPSFINPSAYIPYIGKITPDDVPDMTPTGERAETSEPKHTDDTEE